MHITVTGTDTDTSLELMDAIEFYASCLIHGRTRSVMKVDIDVQKDLDCLGECINEDGTTRSRWFTINLKENDLEEMLQVLAHESVHMKQYVKNELDPRTREHKMWMGKVWKPKGKEHPYFDSPWEIEAYGRERGLYHRYLQEIGEVEHG